MNLPQTLESLANRYEKNPVLRALVQLIPLNIGSAVDAALLTRLQAIKVERARIFFDEIEKGDRQFTPQLLENNEFLHCYFSTTRAVLRTYRSSKIQAFARLLRSSTEEGLMDGIDEYEEFLSIIDELSHREISVLATLAKYEPRYLIDPKAKGPEQTKKFWGEFTQDIERSLRIRPNEISAILTRLTRSGCYEPFTGTFWDYAGGLGMITPFFHRLRDLALGDYEV